MTVYAILSNAVQFGVTSCTSPDITFDIFVLGRESVEIDYFCELTLVVVNDPVWIVSLKPLSIN